MIVLVIVLLLAVAVAVSGVYDADDMRLFVGAGTAVSAAFTLTLLALNHFLPAP